MPHLTKHTDISSGIHSTAWLLLLALATLFVAACGDESAPPPVAPRRPITVESGFFDVIDTLIFDTCDSDLVYDGTYEIQINGTDFSMGDAWTGTWDPTRLQGSGESEHAKVVLSRCTHTTWTTVNITFTSADEFSGSVVYRLKESGVCPGSSECVSSWRIKGVRK